MQDRICIKKKTWGKSNKLNIKSIPTFYHTVVWIQTQITSAESYNISPFHAMMFQVKNIFTAFLFSVFHGYATLFQKIW